MEAKHDTTALILHLNDLRLFDNRPLAEAYRHHSTVYSVVIIDPNVLRAHAFGRPRWSARRVQWYLSAIGDLRAAYQAAGGELLVRIGPTVTTLTELVNQVAPDAVYAQDAKTSEEMNLLSEIKQALAAVECHWIWNDVLIEPDALPLQGPHLPRTFSAFRKRVEKRGVIPPPVENPTSLFKPKVESGDLPTLSSLGFDEVTADSRSPIFSLQPGETGAWQQLKQYFWETDCLSTYKETRNGMTEWSDSSRLSLYLSLGLISPRAVYAEVLKYERERTQNSSTYWLRFELLWREFFHAMAYFKGNELFWLEGIQNRPLPWSQDQDQFRAWAEGRTDVPIVDAAMVELAATGYSSNRARQITASYLVHYLGVDWRLGAAWFEQHLLDYDPCSNWGNWQYVAGVGADTRDRVMSMQWQAERYDPNATFVKRWLPTLEAEDAADLIARNPKDPADS